MKKRWMAAIGALACYGIAAAAIAWSGWHDRAGSADLIVVPGNTVHPDGTPSARLRARLDAAVGLYRERRAPRIFVSGGTGREGQDESAAMERYLVAQGVPPAAVVRDPLGVDTAATAVNAAAYLHAHGGRTALVATQYFHVARTTLALQRQGVPVTGTRHADFIEARDAYSLAREVVGYVAYAVGASH